MIIKEINGFKLIFLLLGTLLCSTAVSNTLWQPFFITPRSNSIQHIDLSGIWELSYMDVAINSIADLQNKKGSFKTLVPNSIQWSHYNAGKLPHPYVSLNHLKYKWLEEKIWYYQKEVTIPESVKGNHLILCFDGIDYFSKVWVNDSLVGNHEGMFGGPIIDVSNLVKFGKTNKITVEVRAANWGNPDYNSRATGKIIKPWITGGGGAGRNIFFSMGMWQGARIEILPQFHIERPFLTTTKANEKEAVLHFSMEILTGINSLDNQLHPWHNTQIHHPGPSGKPFLEVDENLAVKIEFISEESVVFSKKFFPAIYKGTNWLEEDLILPNPMLWYPNGLGDPNLYEIRITLTNNGDQIDQLVFDYGIRTIDRKRTVGPRTAYRWEDWHFIVNGEKMFIKGMNWVPMDVLLDVPKERYQWVLEAARNMGIQMIRVWGGGLIETDYFYEICNELGIMVWQDFTIGNQCTSNYPQDVWQAQVVQNIFRLRNHPSLVVWCGGNEFNPYAKCNTASVGIIERNLAIFDNTRLFLRTTPDAGSMHSYHDMDPCWYNRSYKFEPFISETGMHSMPEANLFYELVDTSEFFQLGNMWDDDFAKTHPEFVHHFDEYSPGRVPRMLSRASHITDLSDPTIESITEATQIGAGEWYQIVSENMQGNYPVTAGLMPWVFKRHWPAIAIQMMDWFGQAAAPYYFLKRTYDSTHVFINFERLLWAPNEKLGLISKIIHSGKNSYSANVSVTVYDDTFQSLLHKDTNVQIKESPSVIPVDSIEFHIPSTYKDRFLLILIELKDSKDNLISRSYYFPRVLKKMEDQEFYKEYVSNPIPWIFLDEGPWLKSTVAISQTELEAKLIYNKLVSDNRSEIQVEVTNNGELPAFMTKLDISGIKRAFFATDNYFWLAPGESKKMTIEVLWREPISNKNIFLETGSWNAKKQVIKLN